VGVVAVVVVLVMGVITLTPLATRWRVPQPVLLTVFGLVVAAPSWVPALPVTPELVLPVVLPPLLFAATQRTTVTEFRQHVGAVLLLAVALTVVTAAVVAVAAYALGLPLGTACLLGAVVSPPDPVAATAVARRLRLPHRLVTVLEGEGMFNDATALVLYKVTLAAVVAGTVTVPQVGLELVLAVVVGIGGGLVAGVLARLLLAAIEDAYAETTITVLVPFLAYLGVEQLHGSGVLGVLTLGLYLRSYGHDATTSAGWLLGRAVWSYADFLVTSLVFALLGFELLRVIEASTLGPDVIRTGVAVIGVVVLVRFLFVFAGGTLAMGRARRRDAPLPVGWQECTVVSWAGMRGVVTVATALAVPVLADDGARVGGREELVVVALGCVLFTLVVQGLTLAPLTTRLRVGADDDEAGQLVELRRRAAGAALDALRSADDDGRPADIRQAAIVQYEGFVAAQGALQEARLLEVPADDDAPDRQLAEVLRQAIDVERGYVLDRRRRGEVSAGVADEVLRDIEGRAVRDLDR
jgi:Na+/H+ antiporter